MTHGTFGWNELLTSNIEASKNFYSRVAGWTYQEMPMGDDGPYTLAFVAGNPVPVAGLMPWPEGQFGSNDWFAYLNVEDIDAAVAAAKGAGGQVFREKFHIENTGWIAIVQDSAKTMIGFLQPEPM